MNPDAIDLAETPKYRHLVARYLVGNGVDIGSGGFPVVPWAIQIELPPDDFLRYNQRPLPDHVEWRGDVFSLPFKDGTLDWVYSSHLIEDFARPEKWEMLFAEWARCLRPGGVMVILVPDFKLWNEAISRGQPPNCSHWAPEPSLGDLSRYAMNAGLLALDERLTNAYPGDYTIMGVFRK